MKKMLIVALLFLGVLLVGCDEKEQKEFTDAMIKQAINDANPIKSHVKPSPTPKPHYDDRESCYEPSDNYICLDGTVYRSRCDGVWKWKDYVGQIFEYCDAYYHKLSCNGYALVDTGNVDEVNYCLVGGAQIGRTYCRGGVIQHQIINCENNGQVCKEVSTGEHKCVTAPPKGYCDFDYLTNSCPISCYPSGSQEQGKQCIQSK